MFDVSIIQKSVLGLFDFQLGIAYIALFVSLSFALWAYAARRNSFSSWLGVLFGQTGLAYLFIRNLPL
jgi:hypothetical protein